MPAGFFFILSLHLSYMVHDCISHIWYMSSLPLRATQDVQGHTTNEKLKAKPTGPSVDTCFMTS